MIDFLIFLLACYGATSIIVWGSIFNKIRPTHKFFSCHLCVGFWVGVFFALVSPYMGLFNYSFGLTYAFTMGCVSSGFSYIAGVTFGDYGINVNEVEK